jgi:hypothetical protein
VAEATHSDRLVVELLQLFKQNRVLGLISDVVDIDVPNDAILVDYEDRTFGDAFLAEDVVLESDVAVRPEIAQQGIRNSAQRRRPCFIGVGRVDADTQDLGIGPVEFGKIFLIRRNLQRSHGGEGNRVERYHDVLGAFETGQRYFRVQMRRERKVGGFVADFELVGRVRH